LKIDITTQSKEGIFSYRVGSVILDSGKILMATNSGSDHYYTVGGRVKLGESAQEAVLREVFEELDFALEIDRLMFIHENFFILGADATPFHEVALFFLMKPHRLLSGAKFNSIKENYGEVSFHWLPIDNLKNVNIFPEFFGYELDNISTEVRHLITKDGATSCLN